MLTELFLKAFLPAVIVGVAAAIWLFRRRHETWRGPWVLFVVLGVQLATFAVLTTWVTFVTPDLGDAIYGVGEDPGLLFPDIILYFVINVLVVCTAAGITSAVLYGKDGWSRMRSRV